MDQSYTVNDLILFIGHCALHFMVQWLFWHISKTVHLTQCLRLYLTKYSSTIIVLGTYKHLYDCSSCSTQLYDIDLHVTVDWLWCLLLFLRQTFLVLMGTFETREFILGQIAYSLKYSSCNASMQPPVSLTFIHGPVILTYISKTI